MYLYVCIYILLNNRWVRTISTTGIITKSSSSSSSSSSSIDIITGSTMTGTTFYWFGVWWHMSWSIVSRSNATLSIIHNVSIA